MGKGGKKPDVGVGVVLLKDSKVLLGKRHTNLKTAGSELHGQRANYSQSQDNPFRK